ncbi:MAG: hypothetical protein G01um101416_223 [Microgenomates group bacterium Gr01-1014_16]|nr:MAG: hypothetical protein G01um101416_223 [Microgenomates group bacterium Gr01-1014_16]
MEIIPAILTNDPVEFGELMRRIGESKKFGRVQIDFIDGEYAANESVKVSECKSVKRYPELKFDAHLMVTERNINKYVQEAKNVGFDRIIAQMESISRPEDFSALALDIHSPVEAIKPYLPKLKYVVVMSVEPGFGGQEFNKTTLDKIRQIGQIGRINGYKFKICVDGGVQKEHLKILEEAGADEVAVGARRVLEW